MRSIFLKLIENRIKVRTYMIYLLGIVCVVSILGALYHILTMD